MRKTYAETRNHKLKYRLLVTIVPKLVYLISSVIFRSCRVTIIGKENEDRFRQGGKPVLFVSWHQGSLYDLFHFRNQDAIMMASQSVDGDMIAKLIELYGLKCARGSSSLGGKQALEVMIDTINSTHCVGGMVPDGPRGPFGVAKIGIVKLAKETGLPLIPFMCWAKRKILVNSWDKHLIPLPFTRIIVSFEPPIFVPNDVTPEQMEKIRSDLTIQLNRMHKELQEYFDNH